MLTSKITLGYDLWILSFVDFILYPLLKCDPSIIFFKLSDDAIEWITYPSSTTSASKNAVPSNYEHPDKSITFKHLHFLSNCNTL